MFENYAINVIIYLHDTGHKIFDKNIFMIYDHHIEVSCCKALRALAFQYECVMNLNC